MKKATDGRRNGILWTMFNQLDDLDFADDVALLSHSHQQMQEILTQVERRSAKTGLRINSKKTKVLKSNTKTRADPTVNRTLCLITTFSFGTNQRLSRTCFLIFSHKVCITREIQQRPKSE